MTRLIRSQWFLIALLCVFVVGHFAAGTLAPLAQQAWPRSVLVMLVMWAMGVTLKADVIGRRVRQPTASMLAIGLNVLFVPLLCLPAMWWLPPQLAGGLFVAGLVPCTLASASVWTRRAGGDDSIAMVTTVATNLACVAVVPLGVQMVLALQTRVAPLVQMEKLAWFVVLPLVVGQLMRRFGASSWADRNKGGLSLFAQWGILVMVLLGSIASASARSSVSDAADAWLPTEILAVAIAAGGVHMTTIALAIMAARHVGLTREEQIAVGFAGSQKTLMVGLQIAIDCGVSVLPMLIYHVGQLLTDTVIADRWRRERGEV